MMHKQDLLQGHHIIPTGKTIYYEGSKVVRGHAALKTTLSVHYVAPETQHFKPSFSSSRVPTSIFYILLFLYCVSQNEVNKISTPYFSKSKIKNKSDNTRL